MKVILKNIKKFFSEEQIYAIKRFLEFLNEEFPLEKPCEIYFTNERIKKDMTTGERTPKHILYVLAQHRLLADVFRTIAHEWVHEIEHQELGLLNKAETPDIGGDVENIANTTAGIVVKKFDRYFPKYRDLMYK